MPAYKYTKGNKTAWYANFYYKDWTGQRHHICKRGFATRREALQYEKDYIDREKNTTNITFGNLVENYMEDMGSRLKPTTMQQKKHIVELKILPYFKDIKIAEITPVMVRKWQSELLNYKDENGKGYAQTYLKSIHEQLSAIMNYACKTYGLLRNPCRAAGAIGKSRASEMNFWTKEQYDTFISHEKRDTFRLAFNILFYTGMRLGEMLALTPADITPDRYIDVNKNYQVVEGEELFLIPKTDKGNRRIAIPAFLYDEIQEYIQSMYKIGETERIFYFGKYAIEREFLKVTKQAGLPRIRVHDLRHSHVSLLIHMDVPIKEISDRLGHESVKTTLDIYGHLYPDSAQETAQKLHELGTGVRKLSEDESDT